MYDKPVFLTREGRQKLEAELKWLRTERRNEVAERIRAAKEDNDITDNAEFEDAKNEQAFTEGRILEVEQILARAVLIDEHQPDHELVRIGAKVTIEDDEGEKEHYLIVGSAEANPREGRISNESPVGRALLGRRVGDQVQVLVPAGPITYRIVSIE